MRRAGHAQKVARRGGAGYPPTSRETSTHRRIFAASSSTVTLLPGAVLAKPHCGLIESWSRPIYFAASLIRCLSSSLASSSGNLEETSPSTTVLCLGTRRSGSKVPARGVAYSGEEDNKVFLFS